MQIFSNYQQDNWSGLLPIVQYQLNSHVSNATKQVPYEMWMGFIPSAHQPTHKCSFPALMERKVQLQTAWQQATMSITHVKATVCLSVMSILELRAPAWLFLKREI